MSLSGGIFLSTKWDSDEKQETVGGEGRSEGGRRYEKDGIVARKGDRRKQKIGKGTKQKDLTWN